MKFQNILKIKVNILLFYLFLIFSLSSCDALFAPTEEESTSAGAYTEEGIASYYADKYEGRPTASGETFRQDLLTAAHKTLPFGTMVTITNLKNGKKIRVKINDRGPFVAGRIIDVTSRGARELDFINDGIVNVKIEYDL
ncbi:rare lipoprotein A [Bernardetia litoralis DSM 6794]|uniref:Probable endolytic peptidoglycan transglycosylase RlpA n=1 Tax=Bernardetia litoralis (strain ATCC 23117 / DSM 6794 / NBRC 15988 / NCIMB 1366 / Fx l1 / Sio-4) TaxID=880071 RepID=I4AQD1_BERLS|nr:septal ring lytic transglycosylase RlpA family protein [Bernardetia litoralis]AFM06166.1 rare lipoprotein A [Bernardetia litoralis DSM 6794]